MHQNGNINLPVKISLFTYWAKMCKVFKTSSKFGLKNVMWEAWIYSPFYIANFFAMQNFFENKNAKQFVT